MKLLLTALLFGFTTILSAQNKPLNQTAQFWGETDLAGLLKKNKMWKWQLDLQYSRQGAYERTNMFNYNSQLTIRPWVHCYVKPAIRVSGFVGLWYNFAIAEVGAREYPEIREAVQVNFYNRKRKNLLVNRLRPEIREIRDREGKYETVLRGRYMLKYQRLLNGNAYDKNTVYLIVFDEIFLNGTSKVTGYRPFDQNRIFGGLGYNITSDIAIETGYFNQFQQHAHDANKDMNHIWQLTLIIDNLNPHKWRPHYNNT